MRARRFHLACFLPLCLTVLLTGGGPARAMSDAQCDKLAHDIAGMERSLETPERLSPLVMETYEISVKNLRDIHSQHCDTSGTREYSPLTMKQFASPSSGAGPLPSSVKCDIAQDRCKALVYLKLYHPDIPAREDEISDNLVAYIMSLERRLRRNNRILKGIVESYNETVDFVVDVAAKKDPFALAKQVLDIIKSFGEGYQQGTNSQLLQKLSAVGNRACIYNLYLYPEKGSQCR